MQVALYLQLTNISFQSPYVPSISHTIGEMEVVILEQRFNSMSRQAAKLVYVEFQISYHSYAFAAQVICEWESI